MKFQLFLLGILLLACTSAKNTSSSMDAPPMTNSNNFATNNAALSLADYLKRVPGVQVMQNGGNTKITVRGNNTLAGQGEPLFIIDGVNVGFGYENAAPLVSVTDIDRVQVLKAGQETAAYGMQGSNGVIVIKTKK
jgi:TonB-dependent SusC/RagA subfamily outer membrane receptor